jgi:catechol 2,3-dioxygenase-like lactoylglutathione lyase family enzyme
MAVLRIVPNIPCDDPQKAQAFYGEILGLDTLMDMDWIKTFGAHTPAKPQISTATQGGSGTPVPAISIEVDALETILNRCLAAGFTPTYGPITEPWGVRRFYVRDPFGTLVNILQHSHA